MYETVRKLHKLLLLVQLLLIIITMILCPVNSRNCNGGVRKVKLYSEFTNSYVRIDKNRRRVVATSCTEGCVDQSLQTVTIDRHYFVIYDPNVQMFICWNKLFTNLIGKRNIRNIKYCKFEEKVSLKRSDDLTRYTTIYTTRDNKTREVEMRFNRYGIFAQPKLIRKCLEKRKLRQVMHKFNVDDLLSLNPLDVDHTHRNSTAFKAYIQVTKHCADPDFVVVHQSDEDCSSYLSNFCDQTKRMRHPRHNIAPELIKVCQKV